MLCWAAIPSRLSGEAPAGDTNTLGFLGRKQRVLVEEPLWGGGWRQGGTAELLTVWLCSSQAAGALQLGFLMGLGWLVGFSSV